MKQLVVVSARGEKAIVLLLISVCSTSKQMFHCIMHFSNRQNATREITLKKDNNVLWKYPTLAQPYYIAIWLIVTVPPILVTTCCKETRKIFSNFLIIFSSIYWARKAIFISKIKNTWAHCYQFQSLSNKLNQ